MSSLQASIRKISKPPSYIYEAITPSDENTLDPGVTIVGVNGNGTAGNIVVEQIDGTNFTFNSMQPGSSAFINPVKVLATGTTATGVFVGRLA